MNQPEANSPFYQHSGRVPFASRLSWHARRSMYKAFMARFRPGPETRILDVGVTSDCTYIESNYLEKLYPYPGQITCVGTEDGSHLMREYPGIRYQQVRPGEPLPFGDRAFDVVFSNAVVEHTGDRASQSAFIHELCRVGRAFFVTTPSRLFPVEHHSGLPFVHYLPAPVFRTLLRPTRYAYWAEESNLNILTLRKFKRLFPPGVKLETKVIRLGGFPSNLIAMGTVTW